MRGGQAQEQSIMLLTDTALARPLLSTDHMPAAASSSEAMKCAEMGHCHDCRRMQYYLGTQNGSAHLQHNMLGLQALKPGP